MGISRYAKKLQVELSPRLGVPAHKEILDEIYASTTPLYMTFVGSRRVVDGKNVIEIEEPGDQNRNDTEDKGTIRRIPSDVRRSTSLLCERRRDENRCMHVGR